MGVMKKPRRNVTQFSQLLSNRVKCLKDKIIENDS